MGPVILHWSLSTTLALVTKSGNLHLYNYSCSMYAYTVVSRKYARPPPFCSLSLSTKRREAYTRDATISLAITPSLPVKHDSIVICRWGVEAKREVSPNARRRDAPDASGGLTSFNIEGRESRALPRI